MPKVTTGFSTTNNVVLMLSRSVSVAAAVNSCATAHNTVSPANISITAGRFATSGEIGQKSWAMWATSGRPSITDNTNTVAITTIVAIGCTKYANALPLATPMSVRTASPTNA